MPPESRSETDAGSGRTDGPEALAARLPHAGRDYLRAALDNPALGPTQVVLLLRNRAADREILGRVGSDERFSGQSSVRVGLASHPAQTRPEAVRILSLLTWRDVVRVVDHPRTPAMVKRHAALMLRERIEGLTLGEILTLARIAPREIIPHLLRQRTASVVRAILENPRLTEADVLTMARRADGGAALGAIARSDRWCSFPAVRWAIIENLSTPVADALHCVRRMSPEDRRRVADHPTLPRLLRAGAARSLRHGQAREDPV